jgi:hypothetical protein
MQQLAIQGGDQRCHQIVGLRSRDLNILQRDRDRLRLI